MPGEVPVSEVRAVWEKAAALYPRGALAPAFLRQPRPAARHRAIRTAGGDGGLRRLMFTLDGVPLLYNGMEVGDNTESAAPALFEKAPIDWNFAERRPQVAPYYQALAQLRRSHPAFTRGAVRWLGNDDEKRVLSFERAGAGETLVVVVNLSSQPYVGVLKTEPGNVPGHHPEWRPGSAPGPAEARPDGICRHVALGPWDFRVFSRVKP